MVYDFNQELRHACDCGYTKREDAWVNAVIEHVAAQLGCSEKCIEANLDDAPEWSFYIDIDGNTADFTLSPGAAPPDRDDISIELGEDANKVGE